MIVDAFANNSKYGTITNDLNEEYDTDYHLDALDFLKLIDSESADCVLYDPPYSLRQVVECYKGVGREVTQETTQSSWRARHLDEIQRILKPGGKALCFGWNSNGVGKKRGFVLQEILLVSHGGSKNDTICTCEVKTCEVRTCNLKVNELFAGIGAFRKALINLNIPHEIVGISEIDKYAIKSYEAMYGETRNYGDISKVERLDYADLWTYGFPCQDISLAGDMKGIVKGETRSGLLHEVERLLEVAKEEGTLPKFLIMENVKNLVSKKFIGDFQRWIDKLSDLGYTTEWKTLIASDYGIPQRRERVFAVSVRNDRGGYSFPEPMLLEKKFRDLLEEEVEEKYFLRKEMLEYFERHSRECKEKGLGFRFQTVAREDCEIAKTITTREGTRGYENFIQEKTCKQVGKLVGDKWAKQHERSSRVWGTDSLCPTLTTCTGGGQEVKIIVPEATKKGYAIAEKGDSIDIAYINQNKRRARVDKERAHTITTSPQIGTLTDHGVRKLTPRECFRLMGFSDSDFEKAQAVCSDTQLYKQAGNSIVVNVLEAIIKNIDFTEEEER